MATAQQVAKVYELYLGRTPSSEETKSWLNTGAPFETISQGIRNSQEAKNYAANPANYENLINAIYQEQLGRSADAEGLQYWINSLKNGQSLYDVNNSINQSLEGQNFDTQYITSLYRQNLSRNPEQAGFQWWMSMAQDAGYTPAELQAILQQSATAEQGNRNIIPGTIFTEMELAALEADPYAGRYATTSIYDLPKDAVNISNIGSKQVQFVNPVTQKAYITNFDGSNNTWSETPGQDILSNPVVNATLQRALNSGALDQAGYNSIVNGLTKATNMDEVRNVLATPKAQVIIDAIYGQQTGEDVNLQVARAEALKRQAVLDANDTGYYQNNFQLADAYKAAKVDFPFVKDAYKGYDTLMTKNNVVTKQNFNERVNSLLESITGQFGGNNQLQTKQSPQYYSESGLQPGFTPFGTEGTTFRSGVAGYIPQSQLPTGFQFGAPPVNATFQQYRPGAFQPEGVATGGYITGYNADGTPIYSTYNNPNVNVGGSLSTLNAYTPTDANAIANIQAQLDAIAAAKEATQNVKED